MSKDLAWWYENLNRISQMVSQTLGVQCEMVVHDFKDFERSVVHISGNVTGRKVGAPVTDLVVKHLKEQGDSVEDILCYKNQAPDGRRLKSSTCFVRDSRGKVAGAVCMNIDISSFTATMKQLEDLIHVNNGAQNGGQEIFASNLTETLDSILERALAEVGKPPPAMTRTDKLKVIAILEREGAFLLKGVVGEVGRALGVTKYTVYNYLNELRAQTKQR